MKVVMDADCLIKLTKAGVKESVTAAMEVHIPSIVKNEVVDEAKKFGHQDALIIEQNIAAKALHVTSHGKERTPAFPSVTGESDCFSLYTEGAYDAIASDDLKFLKKLEAAHIPFMTSAACIAYLSLTKQVSGAVALSMLESLKPFISREEYAITRLHLEK